MTEKQIVQVWYFFFFNKVEPPTIQWTLEKHKKCPLKKQITTRTLKGSLACSLGKCLNVLCTIIIFIIINHPKNLVFNKKCSLQSDNFQLVPLGNHYNSQRWVQVRTLGIRRTFNFPKQQWRTLFFFKKKKKCVLPFSKPQTHIQSDAQTMISWFLSQRLAHRTPGKPCSWVDHQALD